MATGVNVWSKTAATNNTADSAVNWQEGQAPSSVNDSARGMMAATAKWRDDLNGSVTTAGSSTAYTATSNQSFASLTAGIEIACQFDEDCGATVTLNVDGLGAKPLRSAAGVELVAGSIKAGSVHRATYFTSNSGEWLLHDVSPTIIAADQVVSASIIDEAVTNAKLADMANATVKGRATSGTGVPEDLALGQGLLLSGTTLTAPAFPPSGAFKSLVIKVTGNTGLTAAADFVTTTDGTNYKTTALSSTINMGTTGANALDAGSIASGTWYAIWAIAKADGTTAGLASTSFTSPTMPADYTYKARIGAVRTASGSAQLLGTWQFGRRAQYVVGLAQTALLPNIANGVAGTHSTTAPTYAAASVANFVPSTASEISIMGTVVWQAQSTAALYAAPNASYSGRSSASGNIPPLSLDGAAPWQLAVTFVLESTNVYWASNAAGGAISCMGWIDNI